jgi:hypothetical protein
MTGPTEQQQRVIYEWLRPELKGKDWAIDHEATSHVDVIGIVDGVLLVLPSLDYNTFMTGAVPKLYGEGCSVTFKRLVTDSDYREEGYYKLIWGGYPEVIHEACNHDPWLAVIEYLGREK